MLREVATPGYQNRSLAQTLKLLWIVLKIGLQAVQFTFLPRCSPVPLEVLPECNRGISLSFQLIMNAEDVPGSETQLNQKPLGRLE